MFPVITDLTAFLAECYAVFDGNDVSGLETFIGKYKDSSIDAISQFATGLLRDIDAVRNCLLFPEISNGPTEGTNSRIKMVHRRSGGRAELELINAYAVLWSHRETRRPQPAQNVS